jgi:hypothetical protein
MIADKKQAFSELFLALKSRRESVRMFQDFFIQSKCNNCASVNPAAGQDAQQQEDIQGSINMPKCVVIKRKKWLFKFMFCD